MNENSVSDVAEVLLTASLPIAPDKIGDAAEAVIEHYARASRTIALPEDEVADRIREMWRLWLAEGGIPARELKETFAAAIGVDDAFEALSKKYFTLVQDLEKNKYMPRDNAIALAGSAPLIRALVSEQHLGLDRIRTILNIPSATYDAIRAVLRLIGETETFQLENINALHEADRADIDKYFGDSDLDGATEALRGLLSDFAHGDEIWESVMQIVEIGHDPYLFMLYYELLTLESTDRLPGKGIYEFAPRSESVLDLWAKMYTADSRDPYLNNAKSVYALDSAWAETKYSPNTKNGAVMMANIFDILSRLAYPTRHQIAHIVRCFIALVADENSVPTPLDDITPDEIALFAKTVSEKNSRTGGTLDQRLVDHVTMCIHDRKEWIPLGHGSSVNETNTAKKKYGDVEYLDRETKTIIHAYEAHGGSLRDEYVKDHIRTLRTIAEYHTKDAESRGEEYKRDVNVTFVAHDISKLKRYEDGHTEEFSGVPFTFKFTTFERLIEEDAGGITAVSEQTELFDELIHQRISRRPDASSLRARYCEIIDREMVAEPNDTSGKG